MCAKLRVAQPFGGETSLRILQLPLELLDLLYELSLKLLAMSFIIDDCLQPVKLLLSHAFCLAIRAEGGHLRIDLEGDLTLKVLAELGDQLLQASREARLNDRPVDERVPARPYDQALKSERIVVAARVGVVGGACCSADDNPKHVRGLFRDDCRGGRCRLPRHEGPAPAPRLLLMMRWTGLVGGGSW